jgi:hypothetical protein
MNLNKNERIVIHTDTLDDEGENSMVINFDVYDDELQEVTQTGGYVNVRKDKDDKCFYVTVFNDEGDVLSETVVPFIFNNHNKETTNEV